MSGMLNALIGVLTWSAVAEFLLLRTFLRLGPILPPAEILLPVYRAFEIAGVTAMNVAVLAASGVAVGLAGMLLARRRLPAVLLGSLILAAVFANIALELLLAVAPSSTALTFRVGTLLMALPAIYASRGRRPGGTAVGLIAAAETLALAHTLWPALANLGLPLPGGGIVFSIAEATAVAAAIALPLSFRPRWQRRELGIGAGAAFLLLAAYAVRPSTLVAMTMWNLSFTLFLPGAVYAVALGAFTATLLALRRQGNRNATIGLLLIALAGLRLNLTYFSLMALVGFLLCCQPPAVKAAMLEYRAALAP